MKLPQRLTQLAVSTALMLAASAVHAQLYNFTMTGGYTASWQLDASVEPDDVGDGFYFAYWDVPGFPAASTGVADVFFYHADAEGGLEFFDFNATTTLLTVAGPQLYTGIESAPSFRTGTFSLSNFQNTVSYTLVIAAVPEPATATSMLGGLGVLGAAAARRRKVRELANQ
jgi:hypothetical protein